MASIYEGKKKTLQRWIIEGKITEEIYWKLMKELDKKYYEQNVKEVFGK